MAFRFTPGCCCEVECVPPCIPECRVIYLGSDPHADLFTTLDLRDTYNEFSGGRCSYFNIHIKPGQSHDVAEPSETKSNDNHIVARVVTEAIGGGMDTYPECADVPAHAAFRYGIADYYVTWDTVENSEQHSSTVNSRLVAGTSGVTVSYSHSTALTPVNIAVSYDGRYHAGGIVKHVRMICLPFDNKAQPIRFCNGEGNDLVTIPDRVEDYYVTLHGTPGWNCSFNWPTSCGMGGNIQATTVFNANELSEKLDDLCGSWLSPALDFVVVRLFGWATCPINRMFCHPDGIVKGGGFTCPPAIPPEADADLNTSTIEARWDAAKLSPVSIEFQVTFLEKSNHEFEPIVNSPVMTSDVTWDWEYHESANDCPPELRDYITASWPTADEDRRNGRIIFGSGDSSALDVADSIGSPTAMPTRWHITGEHETNMRYRSTWRLWEPHGTTSNLERFNGIYWQLAAISRCGSSFPEDVTGGILHYVPVAEFDVDPSDISRVAGGIYRIRSSLSKLSHNFTYSDMRHPFWYWSSAGSHTEESRHYYVDNWEGYYRPGEPKRPYIVKPSGKHLVRLIWRAFVGENILDGLKSTPESESDLVLFRRPTSEIIGRPSNPVNDFDRTHDFTLATNRIVFLTDTQGPPLVSDDGGGWHSNPAVWDPNGVIANYALNHGQNLYEMSVNGDTFVTFRNNGHTYYMPSLNNRDKLSRLVGHNVSGDHCFEFIDNYLLGTEDFCDPCKAIIYYDFSYLAVWGEGDY